ncbi:MAG: hypothetical protein Q8M77_17260 [Hydrogenophaga sp.]|nr:hypothetical protein [Hydrogenophaga sp.]
METFIETLRLAPSVCLQASATKFSLRHLPPWEAASGADHLLAAGESDITRQLMAGAVYAGLPRRSADENSRIEPASEPKSTLLRYIHSLTDSYQTTHATPPTMRRVAERLAARGQHLAAMHCLHVAEEESGHDTLALMDLQALGLPAQEFVARVRPQSAQALVDLFARLADSSEPIAVLGYAYALERMSLLATEVSIAAIEALLPAGLNATRCLRVHSAVGSDAGHVAESIVLIATLPPQDRAAIARAVYETVRLQTHAPNDYPGDVAMGALLDEFGWVNPSGSRRGVPT